MTCHAEPGTLAALPDHDAFAEAIAGCTLASDIAEMTGIPPRLALNSLQSVPTNMRNLLESPQGWTALAGYVASAVGIIAPDYHPVIH